MELQKKVELYVVRTMGEKLNASFDFLKENWKPLFKFVIYLLLPLSLIQGIGLNKVTSFGMDLSFLQEAGGNPLALLDSSLIVNYLLTIVCAIIGGAIATAIVYSLMQLYTAREGRLADLSMTELKPLLLKNVGKGLILTVFMIPVVLIVMAVIVGLAFLSLWTLLFTIPAFFACVIPLLYFTPIYIFENISIFDAFAKAFRLGFPTWGGIFVVALVMGLISGAAQVVTALPYQMAIMVKYFFTISDMGSEATVSVGYSFFLYLLAVLRTFGEYAGAVFTLLGVAYQYGHASEKMDNVTISSDIDNFDNL